MKLVTGLAICAAVSASALVRATAAVGEQASQPASAAAAQLDVGANFSCAIVTGAHVRCWGYGGEGELGYPGVGTVGATNTPAAIGPVDLGTGFTATAISSGDYHTCAIRNDASVVCWGFGADGRLGYGNRHNVGENETPGAAGPVDLGPGATAKAISAGGGHTCAILDDGTVRCWGFGYSGQLGYGTISNVGDGAPDPSVASAGPVDLGAGHTATAISAGGRHTCAILDDGSVRCWGNGGSGRLGNDSAVNVGDDETPGSVAPVDLGPGRTATSVSAGDNHSCAILDDGTVRCWGYGYSGQLGYGRQANVGDAPVSSVVSAGPVNLGAGARAVAISAGASHTCAILDDGGVVCWGYGADGRLGYGSTENLGDRAAPGLARVDLGPGRTAIAISAGGRHTCARLDGGGVRCWGYGGNGRLGYCDERNVGEAPGSTPGIAGPVNLVPGDGGEPCLPVELAPPSLSGRPAAGSVLSETHGRWSPPPSGYAYQWQRCGRAGGRCAAIAGAVSQRYTVRRADVGARIRVLESARDSAGAAEFVASAHTAVVIGAGGDRARERGFRACQARARRADRTARGLERCVRAWSRTPGPVTGLRAITRGRKSIELRFTAPGTDGSDPPPARSYVIKQSLRPIRDRRAFVRAPALCRGACRFGVSRIGTRIKLTITGLRPHTSYYYAITARDDVTGRPGAQSRTVKATTR